MQNDYQLFHIKGHDVEYIDSIHQYIVDGICVDSITQLLQFKFNHKYDHVSSDVLNKAADKGTEVHKAIEDYCVKGTESDLPELRNFKFLQQKYDFIVFGNEIPVLLFKDDKPICAGRFDLAIFKDGKTGLADIKRTSTLDKEYLGYQLNLYRIAYMQCYGGSIDFLAGIHLREKTRKFINIPINEELIWQFINEWEASNDSRTVEKDIEQLFR